MLSKRIKLRLTNLGMSGLTVLNINYLTVHFLSCNHVKFVLNEIKYTKNSYVWSICTASYSHQHDKRVEIRCNWDKQMHPVFSRHQARIDNTSIPGKPLKRFLVTACQPKI